MPSISTAIIELLDKELSCRPVVKEWGDIVRNKNMLRTVEKIEYIDGSHPNAEVLTRNRVYFKI